MSAVRTVQRLAWALLAAAALCAPASGFVVEGGEDPADDPLDDFRRVQRWDANERSFEATGERGLGGGLEYSIDNSVCAKLTFVDDVDCALVRAAVAEAGARWASGHPRLRFVDISDTTPVEPAPAEAPWLGHGAEIDLFAADPADFAAFHDEEVAADARAYFVFSPKPRDPSGQRMNAARGSITAVDIRFNTAVCYYLDSVDARPGCMHFGSVVLHEFAHVLGLDHPDESPERNLDIDADPSNAMAFDCRTPGKDLKVLHTAERYSVANGRWSGPGYWTRGLTYDDLAGRDALYPSCDIAPVTTAAAGGPQLWGALAVGAGGAYGWSQGYGRQSDARERAKAECARSASGCGVESAFTECAAVAAGPSGAYGWAVRGEREAAGAAALANCLRFDPKCSVKAKVCARDQA